MDSKLLLDSRIVLLTENGNVIDAALEAGRVVYVLNRERIPSWSLLFRRLYGHVLSKHSISKGCH